MEPEEIHDPSPPPQYIVVMDDQTWSTAPANSEGGIMCVESVTGLDGRQAFQDMVERTGCVNDVDSWEMNEQTYTHSEGTSSLCVEGTTSPSPQLDGSSTSEPPVDSTTELTSGKNNSILLTNCAVIANLRADPPSPTPPIILDDKNTQEGRVMTAHKLEEDIQASHYEGGRRSQEDVSDSGGSDVETIPPPPPTPSLMMSN